jgi:hypothetical protein
MRFIRIRPLKKACSAGDVELHMLRKATAMSNTERQRRFRERNPGYYGRLHRKRKQQGEDYARMLLFAEKVGMNDLAARWVAAEVVFGKANLLHALARAKQPLMLPAPVEPIILPGLNTIFRRSANAEMINRRAA